MTSQVKFIRATDIKREDDLLDEFLALVEEERIASRERWGDDYQRGKNPNFLIHLLTVQLGVLAAEGLEEAHNGDFNDAMLGVQQQAVVVAGLLASLYELSERHRGEYLAAIGELGD